MGPRCSCCARAPGSSEGFRRCACCFRHCLWAGLATLLPPPNLGQGCEVWGFRSPLSLEIPKRPLGRGDLGARGRSPAQRGPSVATLTGIPGEVPEWLNGHDWKSCNGDNSFGGSNPPLSASRTTRRSADGWFVEGGALR